MSRPQLLSSMSTTMTGTVTASTGRKASSKTAKSTKIVILRLPPSRLTAFPHAPSVSIAPPTKSSTSPVPTPLAQIIEPSPTEDAVDRATTPGPSVPTDADKLAPPPNGIKRKGIPGPKPGTKRGLSLGDDGMPKPRGKPGPKKKPRLEDGTIDHSAAVKKGPLNNLAPLPSGKPNPKGKDGAINANLRALDRTGKPCRRWEKKGLQLKSFTNVTWKLDLWRTPKPSNTGFPGDVSSDSTVSSVGKQVPGSSALESEKSTSGTEVESVPQQPNPASSPAPETAIPI